MIAVAPLMYTFVHELNAFVMLSYLVAQTCKLQASNMWILYNMRTVIDVDF